jgi:hypothetical protein
MTKKLRADKFNVAPEPKILMKIQEQAQKYKDEYPVTNLQEADVLLALYAQISFDEGYRVNIEETREDMSYTTIKKAKNRRKGWFEYIDEGDLEPVYPLAKKRIASKRMRKAQLEYWKEKGMEWSEELFVLSMVMHTFFEAGYLKAQLISEQVKIMCGDSKHADMVLKLFSELFSDEVNK